MGDLKSATTEDPSGNPIDISAYRYYTPSDTSGSGYVGAIKFVFNSGSCARATAAGVDVFSDSDSAVMPYANNYFEYDDHHRVTLERAQGGGCSCTGSTGQGIYRFEYDTNANSSYADGYNSYKFKTTVTFKDFDGTELYKNTIYANYRGEVILNATTDLNDAGNPGLEGDQWGTFFQYDGQGRIYRTATPAAVNLPSDLTTLDQYNDVLHNTGGGYEYLSSGTGLIYVNDYYSGTTAATGTSGGVDGYFHAAYVQQGQNGGVDIQERVDYLAHSYTPSGAAYGDTIYPVADVTTYGGTSGGNPRTTSFTYTYQLDPGTTVETNRFASRTTYLPVVSSSQNGPGTADSYVDSFDSYGRTISHEDAETDLTTYQYDTGTGAMTQMVQDAGTGRMNLTTNYQVDGLGRVTKETSPEGRVTDTVYLDASQQVRVYPGFNATTGTTTGPIQVTRQYRPVADAPSGQQTVYEETLTTSATPSVAGSSGSYVPTGAETINSGNIQSLSRDLTDDTGRVVESDAYFSLGGVTYSQADAYLGSASNDSSTGNYHATVYSFDANGNIDRTVEPTGTIDRTVFDNLSRPVSHWVGTTDTPASSYWSPTNNTSPSNMLDIEDDVFDGGGVGNSDLTQFTLHPGGSSADDRVTQLASDWRDRQVSEKDGVQSSEDTSTHRPIFYTTYDNLGEVTEVDRFDGDTVQLATLGLSNGVPVAPSSSLLRAQTTYLNDDQGRIYRTTVYDINPSTGSDTTGSTLVTNDFYDDRGNLVATYAPGGMVTKDAFDRAGRLTNEYKTDGGAANHSGVP